ncbi:hypothetical protein M378DRAFT_43028, partial [Amanita muscaria Koide BX008]
LNCLVSGEPYSRIFKVRIEASQAVADLKDAIKEEKKNAFQHVDARTLNLWKVSAIHESDLGGLSQISNNLKPMDKLFSIFPKQPSNDHLHIIVKPRPLLELNCLMSGETYSCIFKVRIEASQAVAHLKDAIKEITKPALDHTPAYALDLWKVSIPVDNNSLENVGNPDRKPLLPVKKLSTVFPEPPVLEHIHIIVKAPA